MTVKVEPLWFVSCDQCTLCRNYFNEADAEQVAEEHDQPGRCPGDAPWIDKKPKRDPIPVLPRDPEIIGRKPRRA